MVHMKISIITLFPEMFKGPFDHSIVKRAIEKNKLTINYINLRNFGLGKHQVVDDTPYGGGTGMILKVDVLKKAIDKAKKDNEKKHKIILLSPHGKLYNQKIAKSYSRLDHLILICGHYEDFDQRIRHFIDEEISIGDYVLTGGEIPAMIITDSVSRLINGVLKEGVTDKESFSPLLEFPQFTKPKNYKGFTVPKVLLSGNHQKINEWRKKEALETTRKLRPDLLNK